MLSNISKPEGLETIRPAISWQSFSKQAVKPSAALVGEIESHRVRDDMRTVAVDCICHAPPMRKGSGNQLFVFSQTWAWRLQTAATTPRLQTFQ